MSDPLARWREGEALIPVRVAPRASKEGLSVETGPDGAPVVRLRVSAPPVDGAANAAVIAALAKALGLPKSALAIVRGARGRDKLVRVARG